MLEARIYLVWFRAWEALRVVEGVEEVLQLSYQAYLAEGEVVGHQILA